MRAVHHSAVLLAGVVLQVDGCVCACMCCEQASGVPVRCAAAVAAARFIRHGRGFAGRFLSHLRLVLRFV